MRAYAIASLVVPIVGVFLLFADFVGILRVPLPPSRIVAYASYLLHLIVVFGPALVGLGLASFVLFAPVFGRQRDGVLYATLGLISSVLLLGIIGGLSAASWH